MTKGEIRDLVDKEIKGIELTQFLVVLVEMGVLIEDGNLIKPHYMKREEDKEGTQDTLE